MSHFEGRLGVQQRVLPKYRVPFFEGLAKSCAGGMSLYAGQPRAAESISTAQKMGITKLVNAHNNHLFSGEVYLCLQRGILDWLESWQPDVLILEANPRYLSSYAAIKWMHARRRPVLGWGLGAPPISGRLSNIRHKARVQLLGRLDGIISYSKRGAQEYRNLGLDPKKIFIAFNAAAPRPTQEPAARPDNFQGRPTILFVGRLQKRKRLNTLFQACRSLPSSIQPKVLIVGDGPARSEFELEAENTYPNTEFLGAIHGVDLDKYYAQADLFVLPGTGGLAVQQAMSHGLPVVVAEGDGSQEDLVSPDNGWLVPPNDLPALTKALSTALEDPKKLRKMGTESFRITQEDINLEEMVASFVGALNHIIQY